MCCLNEDYGLEKHDYTVYLQATIVVYGSGS